MFDETIFVRSSLFQPVYADELEQILDVANGRPWTVRLLFHLPHRRATQRYRPVDAVGAKGRSEFARNGQTGKAAEKVSRLPDSDGLPRAEGSDGTFPGKTHQVRPSHIIARHRSRLLLRLFAAPQTSVSS